MEDLHVLEERMLASIEAAGDLPQLEQARVAALGKKSPLTQAMKGLGGLDIEARKEAGVRFNRVKRRLADAVEGRRQALERADLDKRLATERVDVTLPARPEADGAIHPTSQVLDELIAILADMGFRVVDGPDIEDDFHNFTALNIPPEHPARQMHDTFYLPERAEAGDAHAAAGPTPRRCRSAPCRHAQPPLRIIAPGRTYRCDYPT